MGQIRREQERQAVSNDLMMDTYAINTRDRPDITSAIIQSGDISSELAHDIVFPVELDLSLGEEGNKLPSQNLAQHARRAFTHEM